MFKNSGVYLVSPPLMKFPRNKWGEVEISALVWREMQPPARHVAWPAVSAAQ
jgi:hypothetical protein